MARDSLFLQKLGSYCNQGGVVEPMEPWSVEKAGIFRGVRKCFIQKGGLMSLK